MLFVGLLIFEMSLLSNINTSKKEKVGKWCSTCSWSHPRKEGLPDPRTSKASVKGWGRRPGDVPTGEPGLAGLNSDCHRRVFEPVLIPLWRPDTKRDPRLKEGLSHHGNVSVCPRAHSVLQAQDPRTVQLRPSLKE